jgi:hypothetical protein
VRRRRRGQPEPDTPRSPADKARDVLSSELKSTDSSDYWQLMAILSGEG